MSRNGYRTKHTGDLQAQEPEPMHDPFRATTSSGFYHDNRDLRTRTAALDTASELDVGSATGHTSSSHSSIISRNQGEDFLTTRPSTVQGKTKKFPKFKFSLTAPPPKPKPKLLEQARPAVRVGGRGGAGNARRIKTDSPVSPGSPNNPGKKAASASVENPRAPRPYPHPESETTNFERGSPTVNQEISVPRMETGRAGTGNLWKQLLEDSVSDQGGADEDSLIRQYREMQADQVASPVRRGRVGSINRSDDGHDPTSPQSGSRDLGGRGRGGILRNKSSWTTLSSGITVPDLAVHPGETLEPLLEQGDSGVLVARGYNASLVREGSGRRANAGYGGPPGSFMGNSRLGEPPGRTRPGAMPLPRLFIPSDAPPLPSYQSAGEGRRPSVASYNGMAGSRSQDAPPDNEPDRHFYTHGSNMSSGKETAYLSSQARDPQRPSRAGSTAHSQRGLERRGPHHFGDSMDSPDDRTGYPRTPHYSYQTAHTSPTIVSPPTPSTAFEENPPYVFLGGNKAPKLHVANATPLESDFFEKLDIGHHVRESGGDEYRKVDSEMTHKSREEGRYTPYLDLFGGRGTASIESDSVNHRREGTPFSDNSSVLIPRRPSSDALSSMAKNAQNAQNRAMNLPRPDIPLVVLTRPASRPRSQFEEEALHCDELDVARQRALSRMEKAILRRVEFGQNIDLSRIQLS